IVAKPTIRFSMAATRTRPSSTARAENSSASGWSSRLARSPSLESDARRKTSLSAGRSAISANRRPRWLAGRSFVTLCWSSLRSSVDLSRSTRASMSAARVISAGSNPSARRPNAHARLRRGARARACRGLARVAGRPSRGRERRRRPTVSRWADVEDLQESDTLALGVGDRETDRSRVLLREQHDVGPDRAFELALANFRLVVSPCGLWHLGLELAPQLDHGRDVVARRVTDHRAGHVRSGQHACGRGGGTYSRMRPRSRNPTAA